MALFIQFGCFDFIVNKENEWIFLEINPTGQFLWIEELCPELPMLETFCYALIGEEKTVDSNLLSYSKFKKQLDKKKYTKEMTSHIPVKNKFLSFEK